MPSLSQLCCFLLLTSAGVECRRELKVVSAETTGEPWNGLEVTYGVHNLFDDGVRTVENHGDMFVAEDFIGTATLRLERAQYVAEFRVLTPWEHLGRLHQRSNVQIKVCLGGECELCATVGEMPHESWSARACNPPIFGDRVVLETTASNQDIGLVEFEVFGVMYGLEAIVSVESSGFSSSGGVDRTPELAIDGGLDSTMDGGSCFESDTIEGAFLKLHLEQPSLLHTVQILNSDQNGLAGVLVSACFEEEEVEVCRGCGMVAGVNPGQVWFGYCSGALAQYILVETSDTSEGKLQVCEVFARQYSGDSLVALDSVRSSGAWMVGDPGSFTHAAVFAIDGDVNPYREGESCFISEATEGAWLRVKLAETTLVSAVLLLPEFTQVTSGGLHARVSVCVDEACDEAAECGPVSVSGAQGVNWAEVVCPQLTGNYLLVSQQPDSQGPLAICELQVFTTKGVPLEHGVSSSVGNGQEPLLAFDGDLSTNGDACFLSDEQFDTESKFFIQPSVVREVRILLPQDEAIQLGPQASLEAADAECAAQQANLFTPRSKEDVSLLLGTFADSSSPASFMTGWKYNRVDNSGIAFYDDNGISQQLKGSDPIWIDTVEGSHANVCTYYDRQNDYLLDNQNCDGTADSIPSICRKTALSQRAINLEVSVCRSDTGTCEVCGRIEYGLVGFMGGTWQKVRCLNAVGDTIKLVSPPEKWWRFDAANQENNFFFSGHQQHICEIEIDGDRTVLERELPPVQRLPIDWVISSGDDSADSLAVTTDGLIRGIFISASNGTVVEWGIPLSMIKTVHILNAYNSPAGVKGQEVHACYEEECTLCDEMVYDNWHALSCFDTTADRIMVTFPGHQVRLREIFIEGVKYTPTEYITGESDFEYELELLSDSAMLIRVGDIVTMRMRVTPLRETDDAFDLALTSFQNGYSALVFCGEPSVSTGNQFSMAMHSLDPEATQMDTMTLEVAPTEQVGPLEVTFNLLVVPHSNYTPAEVDCCYWVGAAATFLNRSLQWNSELALQLAPLPVATSGFGVEEEEHAPLMTDGGAGSRFFTIFLPTSSSARLQVLFNVNESFSDHLCLCDIDLVMDLRAMMCSSADLLKFSKEYKPNFEQEHCKNQITLDFGSISTLTTLVPDAKLKLVVVYRSLPSFPWSGSIDGALQMTVVSDGVDEMTLSSATSNIVSPNGALRNIDSVASQIYRPASVEEGSSLTAAVRITPSSLALNAFNVKLQFTFPKESLGDLNPIIISSSSGACCQPLEMDLTVESHGFLETRATAVFAPISFVHQQNSRFEIGISGIVKTSLQMGLFDFRVFINDEECGGCRVQDEITTEYILWTLPHASFDVTYPGKDDSSTVEIVSGGFSAVNAVITFDSDLQDTVLIPLVESCFALDPTSRVAVRKVEITSVGIDINFSHNYKDQYWVDEKGVCMWVECVTLFNFPTTAPEDHQVAFTIWLALDQSVSRSWTEYGLVSAGVSDGYTSGLLFLERLEMNVKLEDDGLTRSQPAATVTSTLNGLESVSRVESMPSGRLQSDSPMSHRIEIEPLEEVVLAFLMYLRPDYPLNEAEIAISTTPAYSGVGVTAQGVHATNPVISLVEVVAGANVVYRGDHTSMVAACLEGFEARARADCDVGIAVHFLGPAANVSGSMSFSTTFSVAGATVMSHNVDLTVVSRGRHSNSQGSMGEYSVSFGEAMPAATPGGSAKIPVAISLPPRTVGNYSVVATLDLPGVGFHALAASTVGPGIGKSFDSGGLVYEPMIEDVFNNVSYVQEISLPLGYVTNMAESEQQIQLDLTLALSEYVASESIVVLDVTVLDGDSSELVREPTRILIGFPATAENAGDFISPIGRTASLFGRAESALSGLTVNHFIATLTMSFDPFFSGETTICARSEELPDSRARIVIREFSREDVEVGSDVGASVGDSLDDAEWGLSGENGSYAFQDDIACINLGNIVHTEFASDAANGSSKVTFKLLVMVQNYNQTAEGPPSLSLTASTGDAFQTLRLPIPIVEISEKAFVESSTISLPPPKGRNYTSSDEILFSSSMFLGCSSSSHAVDVVLNVFTPAYATLGSLSTRSDRIFTSFDEEQSSLKIIAPDVQLTELVEFNFSVMINASYLEVKHTQLSMPLSGTFMTPGISEGAVTGVVAAGKTRTTSSSFQVTRNDSLCLNTRLNVLSNSEWAACVLETSSDYDENTYHPMRALGTSSLTAWRSNPYVGQWRGRQYLKVALVEQHSVFKLAVGPASSVKRFLLQYSGDTEGVQWLTLQQDGLDKEFVVSKIGDGKEESFELETRVRAKWLKFVFTELNENSVRGSMDIAEFSFDLYGCQETSSTNSTAAIDRICKDEPKLPENYVRGFVTDPDKRLLFVCERYLDLEENRCMQMSVDKDNNTVWTRTDRRVGSVLGYWYHPHSQTLAVSPEYNAYLATDDGAASWSYIAIRDWWVARAMSADVFKKVIVIPSSFPQFEKEATPRQFVDRWHETEFRANHEGVWMYREDQFTLVYSWNDCCY